MNLVIDKKNMLNLIICFVLVVVFMFGCAQYTFADSRVTPLELATFKPMQYYLAYNPYRTNGSNGVTAIGFDIASDSEYRVCGVIKANGNDRWGIYTTGNVTKAYDFMCSDNATLEDLKKGDFTEYYPSVNKNSDGITPYGGDASYKKVENVTANIPVFEYMEDVYTYLETGEINNAIFEPEQKYEYSSAVEIPLMAQCQVNGDRFLFNCMQTESHNDYRLQINASVSLTPIYSNLTSKKYADTEQIFTSSKNEIGKYYNHETTFNVSFTTTDLLNGIDTSRTALGFKEFYNGYNILLPYKEATLSKIYFYARNVCGSKCSNWVKVTFDLITETSVYEEVESVSGSNVPSDTKKDSSEYYPSDYIYNDDEPYQGDNNSGILGYIKSGLGLVGNNSIIALIGNTFSFLPRELTTLLLFGGALLVAVGIIKVVTR